jgi:chromosome segregation ATPase
MVGSESYGNIIQANTFLEDLQKLDAVSEDKTRKDLHQCRDDQEKTRQELETLQEFTTASTDLETRKDLQQRRDDQEKTRQELETLQEELRDTKAQHATQLAALCQEHETKLKDAKSAYASLETYAQTMSEHFKTAQSLVSTQNSQISELKKLATMLQQRNQLALALRDTKSQYDRLVEYVENTILK